MRRAGEPRRRRTPWRDNIEAMTVAIVMAVFLKYFIVEAYKIPTGSMQPTLMGQAFDTDADGRADGGVFDRILVDKLSYHLRDPQRFEVVVFKYPLDRSKNFVKRLVGLPGEELRIENGDLWVRPDSDAPWAPLRRPQPVQRATWKALDLQPEKPWPSWRPEPGAEGWVVDGRDVLARGDGRALFSGHGGGPIRDAYVDGYPAAMRGFVPANQASGQNDVGDLRVEGEVQALESCQVVFVDLQEGPRLYHFELPGPAAPADARPSITISAPGLGGPPPVRAEAPAPYRLPAGRAVAFAAQNLDDLLELEVDGERICALDAPPAQDQRSAAWIGLLGGAAELSDLQVYRDIYYLEGTRSGPWTIPPGHYFMLGDNTQDSSDSREWTLWTMRWEQGDDLALVRGNYRPQRHGQRATLDANPVRLQSLSGPTTWFRDQWGELHVFPTGAERPVPPEEIQVPAPFVPRELITGRALLVFWPLAPSLDVYRLKWVR